MKKLLIIFAFLVVLAILCFNTGCDKGNCKWDLPPNTLYFRFEKNKQQLPDSILSKIKLYYIKNGEKIYRPGPDLFDTAFMFPAIRTAPGLANTDVMINLYVSTGTWYFEFPDNNVDTLYTVLTEISCKEGQKDRCNCEHPLTEVKFNGKDAPIATDIQADDGKAVYLFEK